MLNKDLSDSSGTFSFRQVDVFSSRPLRGNPLAVVLGADCFPEQKMLTFANWMNLSETTFLLRPANPQADYRVRIFTPSSELPFAGHPTLGSCHAWLASTDLSEERDIIQECRAGLVRIRRDGDRLAFAGPPLIRTGVVEDDVLARIKRGLGLSDADIVAAHWVDNGPGWLALLMKDREAALALKPDFAVIAGIRVGIVAPVESGETDFEVRAFSAAGFEDPVTGSLNAGIAQWLISSGIAPSSYTARQGTVLGREGTVYVTRDGNDIWIGGNVVTCIEGQVSLETV